MTTRKEIEGWCVSIAPGCDVEPLLALAMCEQESSYDPSEVRLENGFYRRYVRPMTLPPSSEVLLSASYGLMQVMGEVLLELGLFDEGQPLASQLDAFMEMPDVQISYGCRQLARIRKQLGSAAHTRQVLQRYNGGGNPNYAGEVLERFWRLSKERGIAPCDDPV